MSSTPYPRPLGREVRSYVTRRCCRISDGHVSRQRDVARAAIIGHDGALTRVRESPSSVAAPRDVPVDVGTLDHTSVANTIGTSWAPLFLGGVWPPSGRL